MNAEARNERGSRKFICSRRRAIIFLVLGISILVIAVWTAIVLIAIVTLQTVELKSLRSESERLREENGQLLNTTKVLEAKLSACDGDLLSVRHQMEINSLKCEVDKLSATRSKEAEAHKCQIEKKTAEEKLEKCKFENSQFTKEKEKAEKHIIDLQDALADVMQQKCSNISMRLLIPPRRNGTESHQQLFRSATWLILALLLASSELASLVL